MTDLIRRFRGLAVALVVLAISAGAVFAAAPALTPTAAPQAQAEEPAGGTTSNPDKDADEDGDDDAKPEAPEAPDADEDDASEGAPADTHGAIVSAAAKTETPEGFANHGQFVSCVAHMDVLDPAAFDPAKVTPADCGITPEVAKVTGKDKAAEKQATGKAKAAEKNANGKAKAAAAKAKAAAKQAQRANPTTSRP